MGIKLFQMEVKCALFNGFLQEEVYVEQPPVSKIPILLIMCLSFKKTFIV